MLLTETIPHTLSVVYFSADSGNDCDVQKVTCTCGFTSRAQEGGGDWQSGRSDFEPHHLDQLHLTLYETDKATNPCSHAGWCTQEIVMTDTQYTPEGVAYDPHTQEIKSWVYQNETVLEALQERGKTRYTNYGGCERWTLVS